VSNAAIPATVDEFLNCTGVYREGVHHDDVFCPSCVDVDDVVVAAVVVADVDGSDSGCLRPRGASAPHSTDPDTKENQEISPSSFSPTLLNPSTRPV
jgi:hypothetical protein